MKVSIHTMYYLPDFGSAPILMNELAGYLADRGHEVEVVTTIPRKRPPDLAGLLYSRRDGHGFAVKRFWTNATPHPLGRLLAWNIYTAGAFFNAATLRRGDVLMLRTPPLQLGFVGFWAKLFRGVRILLNVQDIHPDLSIESGILRNPAAIRMAKALEKWVYGLSDRIMVISEGFKDNLLKKGVPAAKLAVIPNWVDTDFLKPLPKDNPVARKYGLHDKFVLMYSGTVSISSNVALERVLDAAGHLDHEKDVLFVICGEGLKKESLRAKAEVLGLQNVLFLPFQRYADLPALLASSDVLLVPLDVEKSQLSVPSKLYNCMAAGRAILGLATGDSEVASIIHETGCGLTADPRDAGAIADAILSLKSSPEGLRTFADNARSHVVQNFAMDRILRDHETLLESLS